MAEQGKEEIEKDKAPQVQEEPKRKKVPINLIIICILGLSLLGGGVYVWKSGLFSGNSDETDIVKKNKKPDIGTIFPMDTFIVNLIGDRGKNYLKAKVELELDSQETTIEMNKRLPQIKDSILTMLSSKTNDDINTLDGKLQLRAEIMATINQYLATGKVINVYFTDFIIQ